MTFCRFILHCIYVIITNYISIRKFHYKYKVLWGKKKSIINIKLWFSVMRRIDGEVTYTELHCHVNIWINCLLFVSYNCNMYYSISLFFRYICVHACVIVTCAFIYICVSVYLCYLLFSDFFIMYELILITRKKEKRMGNWKIYHVYFRHADILLRGGPNVIVFIRSK